LDFSLIYFESDGAKFKVNIEEAKFITVKHTLRLSIFLNQLKIWQSGHPACYPMRRTELKNYSIPAGTIQHVNENLLSGLLPDRNVIGLVSSSSYHDELKSVAYDFDHNNLRNVQITVNSDQQTTLKYDVDVAND